MKTAAIKAYLNSRRTPFRMAIAAACAVIALTCAINHGIVQAVFTSSLHAQRTIAAYDTEGDRFSSNYLLKGDSKNNIRTVFTTSVSSPVVAVVTVCNYQQGRQTLAFAETVSYTLTARLVKYDGTDPDEYVPVDAAYLSSEGLTGYTVTLADDAGTVTRVLGGATVSTAFSGTLAGGTAVSDAYTVTFSTGFAEYNPNLYLEMIAVPNTRLLPTIRGVFKPDLRAAGASDYWTGAFRDNTASAPSAYDGFNYLVSGMGSGTATLSWDGTRIKLSDVSRDVLLAVPGASQTGNSITFPVDSDLESHYDLQFYKVNISSETWPQMSSSVVTFSFS